ncbi:hypothetical protein Tco_1195279, partial [Tanacetum coccineum]
MESLNFNSQERERAAPDATKRQMPSNGMACFKGLESHLRKEVTSSDLLNLILQEHFKDYMGSERETYKSNLLVHLDLLEKFIDKSVLKYGELRIKDVQINIIKALDDGLVVTKSSGTKSNKQDTSSSLGNDTTHAVDANIIPVNDQEPLAE